MFAASEHARIGLLARGLEALDGAKRDVESLGGQAIAARAVHATTAPRRPDPPRTENPLSPSPKMTARQRTRKPREAQEKEAQKRTAPPGTVVYQAIYSEAEHELHRTSSALAWSGLAAGLSMGFSLLAQALFWIHIVDPSLRALLIPLGYTVGFLIVILGRQQLFTENTLTPILPLLKSKKPAVFFNVGRLWLIVLATNLLGGFVFACVVAFSSVVDADVRQACAEISRAATTHDFFTLLLRGIFAGWLIGLMIWLLPFAESARVWVIALISYLIGLAGLPHIIAGGIESFYLVVTSEVSVFHSLTGYLLPTLIGNTIGGVALVAALAHAQFATEKPPADGRDIAIE